MTSHPQRILIFGRPGSGKSNFAYTLSQKSDLPVYHLDKYFFESGWVERPSDAFLADQAKIVDQTQWIIDGNALRSLEMRWSRADLVLYFDLPSWPCIFRIMKRYCQPDTHIDDRSLGCPERLSWRLLRYLIGFHKRATPLIQNLQQRYPKIPLHTIRTRANAMYRLNQLTESH